MPYPYDQVFAADPATPENVASNGVVTIFAPGDPGRTPLTITTLDGLPLSNPMQVNDAGFGPAFMHATRDQVAWAGGGFSGLFVSYKGMKDEAIAARAAAETVIQRANAGEFRGAAGIGWGGEPLGNADLNTVTTPGLYFQSDYTMVTPSRNYPNTGAEAGQGRRLAVEVLPWHTSSVIQRITIIGSGSSAGSPQRPRVVYERYGGGTWSSWSTRVSQRVDNTAGRAIYTWDDTAGREQLIYGDTGWRKINSLLPTLTGGNVAYRRSMFEVSFLFDSATFSDPVGTQIALTEIPGTQAVSNGVKALESGNPDEQTAHKFRYQWSGAHSLVKKTSTPMGATITFPVRSTWPTALAGAEL